VKGAGLPTNLPNLLTLSRIAAIPLLVLMATLRTPWGDVAACAVFAAAGITDYYDGKIARQRKLISAFGRMLDPIADKLLVGSALMLLAGLERLSPWGLLPAIVILLREIMVSGLREYLAALAVSLPVTRLAKWKTGAQMGALGTLLAGDTAARVLGIGFLPVAAIGEAMLWIAAVLTLMTGWDYVRAGLRHAGAQDVARAAEKPNPP
jgi:cardiolipin synthase